MGQQPHTNHVNPFIAARIWESQVPGLPDPKYVLERILPEAGIAEVFGPPGVGKSFLTLAWMLCLAHGKSWCGLETGRPIRVLNLLVEGHVGDVKKRYWAARQQLGIHRATRHLWWSTHPLNLFTRDEIGLFLEVVQPWKPRVLHFDTLSMNTLGMDENDSGDMGRVLDSLRILQESLKCLILYSHHPTKYTGKSRGHGSLGGAVGLSVKLEPYEGDQLRMFSEKNRQGSPFELILQKKIVPTPYGSAEKGTHTTLVLEPVSGVRESAAPEPALDQQIVSLIRESGPAHPCTPHELAIRVGGISERSIRRHLIDLEDDGRIRKTGYGEGYVLDGV